MKTFGSALLLVAVASAKKLPTPKSDVPELPTGVMPTIPEADMEYWEGVKSHNWYARNLWLGTFQGLYGMSSGNIERPTEECFGNWIPEKMQDLSALRHQMKDEGLFSVSMDEARSATYDVVDLMYLNDEYCHFRQTFHDMHSYCASDKKPCAVTNALENM